MWPHDVIARFDARPVAGRPDTWRGVCNSPEHGRREQRCRTLSIWLPCPGRLCLGCWACRARNGGNAYKKEILARVGLTMGDLFAPDERNTRAKDVPHVQPKVVAVYAYCDEAGEVLWEKLRYEPKDFRQRRPDGRWGIDGVRRVPFQLCEMLARPSWPVLLLEGEKDVLSAEALGLVATCVTEGAGSGWDRNSPYPKFFVGRRVVVIPDEDAAGLTHAPAVVGALIAGGVASVRLVRLPGLQYRERGGPDLTDWIAGGGTRDQLIEAIKQFPEYRS